MRPSVSSALPLMEKNNFKRQFSQPNIEFIENDFGVGDAFMVKYYLLSHYFIEFIINIYKYTKVYIHVS